MARFPTRLAPVLLVSAAALPLAGCSGGGLARDFGFVRDAPDEFTVTTQAPLSMPPDFSLRPPRPGAPRPQERSDRVAAEQALAPQLALQGGTAENGPLSPGQQALLAQAGPPAPANVRAEVDRQAIANPPSQGFIDRLMFWRSSRSPGEVLDAQQESERLRQDAALGQSPTTGPTPIIRSRQKGLLEGIF